MKLNYKLKNNFWEGKRNDLNKGATPMNWILWKNLQIKKSTWN